MRIDLSRQEHDFSLGQRPHGRYIAAIILLHLALFWAATQPAHTRIEHDDRVWLQLVPPLPPTRGFIPPAKPNPAPARPPVLPSRTASVSPPKEATASVQDQPQDDALPAEPVPTGRHRFCRQGIVLRLVLHRCRRLLRWRHACRARWQDWRTCRRRIGLGGWNEPSCWRQWRHQLQPDPVIVLDSGVCGLRGGPEQRQVQQDNRGDVAAMGTLAERKIMLLS